VRESTRDQLTIGFLAGILGLVGGAGTMVGVSLTGSPGTGLFLGFLLAALTVGLAEILIRVGRRLLIYARRAPAGATPALLAALYAHGDIISDVENAIVQFFTDVWDGIESFFGTIFDAIANTFATIFSAPASAIQSSFNSLSAWASEYGPLAPIITIVIVGAVLIIAIFLIWLIIKISLSEGEETAEEAEEGV
jgi:hypothetical protein